MPILITHGPCQDSKCKAAGINPAEFSPALRVDSTTPPTLVLAGSKDNISKTKCNQAFIESMKKNGRTASFIEYIGQGHALFKRHKSNLHFRATIYYMERFLKARGYLSSCQKYCHYEAVNIIRRKKWEKSYLHSQCSLSYNASGSVAKKLESNTKLKQALYKTENI